MQSSPLDLGRPWGEQRLWGLPELFLAPVIKVQETEAPWELTEGPPWLQENDGNP